MIINARYKKPSISFGLGVTSLEVNVGQTVKVWLDTLFNVNEYSFELMGVEAVEVSPYEWEISDLVKGNSYTITMNVSTKKGKPDAETKVIDKSKILKSNPLTLTVL